MIGGEDLHVMANFFESDCSVDNKPLCSACQETRWVVV